MLVLIKKYKVLLCIELIIFFVLLISCFAKEKPVFSDENIEMNAYESIYKGQGIQLKPGVYQVRVKMEKAQEEVLYVGAEAETSSFRAFRCNGVPIFVGQKEAGFEIYVLENIDSASITCNSFGQVAQIDSIEVYWVNWGNRMLTFLFAVVCLIVNFMLAFRDGVLSGKISKEKQVVFCGLFLAVMVAYFPYMTDYFSDAADITFHWLRIENLKNTLMDGGQFPVRIQGGWLYDHGYAVSSFYGDLFLLIPVFFRLLGFSLMSSYKMFVFVLMIATAGISYFSFWKCTKHRYASLFGSIIYVLAPYRIYNFYNRGAVGECLAMTFLPLVISGMYCLYTENIKDAQYKNAKISLIVGLSCLLQSHLLSTEITIFFILVSCIIFVKKTIRKETFLQLLQSAVICLLINMWFWLPLIKMIISDKYKLSDIISKDIQYMGTWFAEVFQLYPNQGAAQNGMYMAEPFQIGIASLMMLIIAIVIVTLRVKNRRIIRTKNPYDKAFFFWCMYILVSWIMSTSMRYFPWDLLTKVPVLSTLATAIQFPTRMFIVATVFIAIMAVYFYLWFEWECKNTLKKPVHQYAFPKGMIITLLILAFGSAVYHVNDLAYEDAPIWLYNAENMGTVSAINGEYLLTDTMVEEYSYHEPVADPGLKWWNYNKNGTNIELELENSNAIESYIEVPLIGYKGYGLECEDSAIGAPYITEQRGEHGDLRVAVPAGYQGRISIWYEGFACYRVAEWISALTILGIAVHCAIRRVKWKAKA